MKLNPLPLTDPQISTTSNLFNQSLWTQCRIMLGTLHSHPGKLSESLLDGTQDMNRDRFSFINFLPQAFIRIADLTSDWTKPNPRPLTDPQISANYVLFNQSLWSRCRILLGIFLSHPEKLSSHSWRDTRRGLRPFFFINFLPQAFIRIADLTFDWTKPNPDPTTCRPPPYHPAYKVLDELFRV